MLTVTLIIISGLFLAVLAVRHAARKSICALCAAVALTWLGLFLAYKLGRFDDTVLLSLLMGQSITGIFYFVQKRVPPTLKVFSLPFFLSLTVLFYFMITSRLVLPAFGVLTVLWVAGWLLFVNRSDPGTRLSKVVMECCGGNNK